MNLDTITPSEEHYFYRTACFSRQGDHVALVDINNLAQQTMLDAWFSVVYSLADGQHSVGELIGVISKGYTNVPDNLCETLFSVLQRMIDGNLIKICNTPVILPYHVSGALNELDISRAHQSYKDTVSSERKHEVRI